MRFIFQDLYNYHKRALESRLGISQLDSRLSVPFLTQQAQLFVSNLLSKKPLLGCSLVKCLQVDLPQFHENNLQLMRLHLGCLQTQLLILNRSLDLPEEFLELLSLFEPSEEEFEDLRVKDFLKELSEFAEKAGSDALGQIYAKLIRRNSKLLLDQFSVIHSESQRTPTTLYDQSSPNQSTSWLALVSKRPISYIDLYWSTLKNEQHFLEAVVVRNIT